MPDLNSTLKKYLRCVKSIVSEDDYKKTARIVNEFSKPGGIGQSLQNNLLKYAFDKENWVLKFFFNSNT